jgi:hypothetical protein
MNAPSALTRAQISALRAKAQYDRRYLDRALAHLDANAVPPDDPLRVRLASLRAEADALFKIVEAVEGAQTMARPWPPPRPVPRSTPEARDT